MPEAKALRVAPLSSPAIGCEPLLRAAALGATVTKGEPPALAEGVGDPECVAEGVFIRQR